jgi:transketolase
VVTAEEHNYLGGLGESVSRILAENHPVPQEFVATRIPLENLEHQSN